MIRVGVSKNKKKITVKMGGDRFWDFKDILNDYQFQYNDTFEGESHIWTKTAVLAADALLELLDIENFKISDEVLQALNPEPETKFVRNPFEESLLKSKPIGDFQIRAIKQGITQSRLYLAHKMGLGKSFMIISILNHLMANGSIDRILIVAPTESIINFKRELLRFNTFNLKEEEIGIASTKNRTPFNDTNRVVIARYRSFLMISDDYYKKKTRKKKDIGLYKTACIPFDKWGTSRAIVLDEAHLIKTSGARWTNALNIHKHFFEYRYLLSGTPYPKGIEDLYSQIKFMDDNLIPIPYSDWLPTIAQQGTDYSQYEINGYKEEAVKDFLKHIDRWIIREFTEDNLDLPERFVTNTYVEMNPAQRRIYQEFISYRLDQNISKNGRIVMREIFSDFPNISLALDNPSILKEKADSFDNPSLQALLKKWKFKDHSKVEALDSLLEKFVDEEGKKTIIWSGHPLTIMQLEEHYQKYNPIAIHGELKTPKGQTREDMRDELVERFKKNPDHKILIASYYMIARAVNIVEAPRSICFDRPWNFEIWDQMTKRNHRYGSTEDVFIKSLVIEESLDERLDRTLIQRERVDRELLEYRSLSKEQWKSLFEGKDIM